MFVVREIVVAAIASAAYRSLVTRKALTWCIAATILGAALVWLLIQ
jgi:hypothetical protein